MPRASDPDHAVTAYARDVVARRVPASKPQIAACRRHLSDLRSQKRRGIRWVPESADFAIQFFETVLRHVEGEWAGQPFLLEPWQKFIVGSLFGWRLPDGSRRFRTAYIEIPRKNGKSSLIAGLVILCTFFEDEPGAQGYCAATKRDQAKIVFGVAKRMIRRSPALRKRLQVLTHNVHCLKSESKLEPVGADADTLDGLNPQCVAIDELHAHPSSKVVDVMETAMGARRQPLLVEITTAGYDRESICWRHHELSLRILDPKSDYEDDSWFAFVAGLDERDDWRTEAAWRKANPNYGVSVKPDWIARMCKKAEALPAAQNAFRQKNLDEWLTTSVRALDMAWWDREPMEAPIDEEALRGRECFAGLDLAKVGDVSALALLFPPQEPGELWKVVCRFWIPQDDIILRSHRDRVPYDRWQDAGLVIATPGDVTDYDFIEAEVLELAGKYQIRELAYDQTFAGQLAQHLEAEGVTMVAMSQGFATMCWPTGEFMRKVKGGELQHGKNPVLRWMADNLVVRRGVTGDTVPDKKRSREKIDGVVALILAIARAIVAQPPEDEVLPTML